ncbi:helix-turn-helix domain-containing protein [Streptomyces sp. NPDC096198]|uniref:helix-turn-helix domain-containing protein n=1 Tax=Streptomyces sp. NPDC096198 TaxID=3366080 RepID=UPI0037FB5F52
MSRAPASAGLEGKALAARLGWQTSKVSRLQNGRQPPPRGDLTAWVSAIDRLDVETELHGLLACPAMKQRNRSWRRQLAGGHRGRQEIAVRQTESTSMIRVPGGPRLRCAGGSPVSRLSVP